MPLDLEQEEETRAPLDLVEYEEVARASLDLGYEEETRSSFDLVKHEQGTRSPLHLVDCEGGTCAPRPRAR